MNALVTSVNRRRPPHAARTVLIGTPRECRFVAESPAFELPGYRLTGFVDTSAQQAPQALGSFRSLRRILLETRSETVVVCTHLDDSALQDVVEAARDAGCELLLVPRAYHVTGVEPQLVWRRGQPLIELTSPSIKGQQQILKRIVDIVGASLGLVASAPLFAVLWCAIKLDTPGPAIYRSSRWGRFGKRIEMFKFRTMVDGAADWLQNDHALQAEFSENIKIVDDPRVTRVGRWLRRWSLDELPQLYNVLMGDLSLVGPRPKLLGEEERYGAAFDTVLSIRPGLTGLWQVSGRNNTSYEERVALDVRYVAHQSFWWDMEILVRTVPVVLTGVGAH